MYGQGRRSSLHCRPRIDKDGRTDFGVASFLGHSFTVLFGDGSGGVTGGQTLTSGRYPNDIQIADYNRDGKLDFATTFEQPLPGHVGVFWGRGNGTFSDPIEYPAGEDPYDIGSFDGNGDGSPDLFVASISSGTVTVLVGRGDGRFESAKDYAIGAGCFNATTGDFDGDGRPDLAAIGGDQVRILRNETP